MGWRNQQFYPDPILLDGAQLAPTLKSADANLTAFDTAGVREILATLSVYEYLTTALTGANNDLNIIARAPGSTDYTVEYKDPSANNAALSVTVHAYLKTALAGANNDLVFHAVAEGSSGEAITIAYVDPSANDATESVTVSGNAITFHLATGVAGAITSTGDSLKATLLASAAASALVTAADAAGNDGSGVVIALAATALAGRAIIVHLGTGSGGAITSTAAQVAAAIAADTLANALVVVENTASNTGAGVVIALAQTALAGPAGTNPTMDVKLQSSVDDGTSYFDVASFTQATTTGISGKVFSAIGPKSRWALDIGGTSTPVFAMSIATLIRQ
jgi:hypothetical protein